MTYVVFWDIDTWFVHHRKHITSPPQDPASYCGVTFEVSEAVAMKKIVFWDTKTRFAPHRKHHFSAAEPSRLMLRNI
jgi:hypothetical protein